jgi:hypothetical protein
MSHKARRQQFGEVSWHLCVNSFDRKDLTLVDSKYCGQRVHSIGIRKHLLEMQILRSLPTTDFHLGGGGSGVNSFILTSLLDDSGTH